MQDRSLLEKRLMIDDLDTCVLCYGVVTFGLILRECERIFRDYGLSTGEFAVLLHVRGIDQEVNLSRIKNDISLFSGASITKVAEKLQKKGYITRRENPKSRREKLVRITASGKRVTSELLNATRGLHGIFLGKLNTKDKNKLLDCLKIVHANVTDCN